MKALSKLTFGILFTGIVTVACKKEEPITPTPLPTPTPSGNLAELSDTTITYDSVNFYHFIYGSNQNMDTSLAGFSFISNFNSCETFEIFNDDAIAPDMDINDGDIKSYGSSFPSNGTLNLSFEDTCTGIFNAWENVSSGVTLLYEKFPNKITLTINGDFVNDNNTTDTLRLTNVVYSAPI